MIVIIDYGLGNIASISNMFRKLGIEAVISSDLDIINDAEKLILPGVGAFDEGMRQLSSYGFLDILNKKVLEEKTPILGICLGVQLFTKSSEEGKIDGLGWINVETKRFNFSNKDLKIPHMGWNSVEQKKSSKLFNDVHENPRFYFVHSYHLACSNQQDVLATSDYGFEFVSAVEVGNIYGVQFHPEKSHKFGMRLLKNFGEL